MPNFTLDVLERSLDASALRHRVISNNIANVSTPNYKSKRVLFESLLSEALEGQSSTFVGKRTDPRHFPIGQRGAMPSPVTEVMQTTAGNNGNNVDVDYEMSALAKNQLQYYAVAQQMSHEFSQMRLAISGRR